ncbi:hypothetical protein C8J57DRAFT_1482880 [Mycena rebaudengoi]|nr:hypothetical protein C8J57DRAFT_1482880 [Mycena rebaudengoi]
MDTKFRPLLPKPLSQARPEPFLISTASNQYASSHQETTGTSSAHALSAKACGRLQSEFERRSLGQKKRRQRESKENQSNPKGSKQMNPYRSAAQRARRQASLPLTSKIYYRPVGAKIFDLELKYYEGKLKKERGVWSQTLIVVYPTQAWTEHLIMNMMIDIGRVIEVGCLDMLLSVTTQVSEARVTSSQRLKECVDDICRARLGNEFPEEDTCWLVPLDYKRGRAVNPNTNEAYFDLVEEIMAGKLDYHLDQDLDDDSGPPADFVPVAIKPENIYSMDERGFFPAGGVLECIIGPRDQQTQHKQSDGGQLAAQKASKKKKQKGCLVGNGMPQLLTSKEFVQQVEAFKKVAKDKEVELEQRRVNKVEQADVKAWEEEHDHMKLLGKRCRVDYLLSMTFANQGLCVDLATVPSRSRA